MPTSSFLPILNALSDKNHSIVIVSHTNPDGDAIGSSLGLYHYLKNVGFGNIRVVMPGSFPAFLKWMESASEILIPQYESDANTINMLLADCDILFCLDFNDIERTANLKEALRKSEAIKVLIDHHPNPKNEFDIILSDVSASSTSELIYQLIHSAGHETFIDKKVAECLYAGIVTDTGSFSYSCNNRETYYAVAHLIATGIDGEHIHRLIYDTFSEDRLRLLGFCLSSNLRVLKNHQTAYIFLSRDELIRFNHKDGDTEGVVNYALSIQGISLGAIFIEREDKIKISFRSERNINVNKLAREHFSGGGHINASGGHFNGSLDDALGYFEKVLEDLSPQDFLKLRVPELKV